MTTTRAQHIESEWIGGGVRLPSYVTDEDSEAFRPEVFLWIDQDGRVLGNATFRPGEASSQLGASFRATASAPAVGAPHVPSRIRVASTEIAEILRRELGDTTTVVCAPTPEIDEAAASLLAHLQSAPMGTPTYLTAGIQPEAVARLCRAAARLYRAAPWKVLSADQSVLSVTIEALGIIRAPLAVIGQVGESFAVVLFPDDAAFDAFLDMASEAAAGGEPGPSPPHRFIDFEPRDGIEPKRLEEISAHGWEVAAPDAHPTFVVVDDDGLPRPPTGRDLAILEGVAQALSALLETEAMTEAARGEEELEELEETFEIETSQGAMRVVLATPLDASIDEDERQDNELLAKFEASPEADALETHDGWPEMLLEYARSQCGATATSLSAEIVEEVVFETFPRQVSCDASAARAIVTELRAFFTFAARERAIENAAECLAVLDENAEEELHDVLSDPEYFGMAKSFVMSGKKGGFDMTTQAGTDAWLLQSNALMAAGAARSLKPAAPALSAAAKRAKRNKRKAVRKGKRKNR